MTWPNSWNGTRQSVSGGTRRSPRRSRRRVRAHYAWERLGLGRWRERCLWVGRNERGKTERDGVRLSSRDGDPRIQREHRACCNRAERRISAGGTVGRDRKSTRLNSSHGYISYAVFCLKKKK